MLGIYSASNNPKVVCEPALHYIKEEMAREKMGW